MNRFLCGVIGSLNLLLAAALSHAAQVQRIPVSSAGMAVTHQATVVLPDDYKSGNDNYPVIYVLHGWSGDDTDWTNKTRIAEQADRHHVILVMPDGAYDKWYVDSPVNTASRYATYVGKELVTAIDSRFRTVARKEGRAITGLSMGGFGALHIALKFAGTFGAAGSMSGGVDPRPFAKNWGLESVLGDIQKTPSNWDAVAIVNNADRFIFSGIDLSIECGVDDFFIDSNRALHQRLLALNVAHDYAERPGGHTWEYWSNAVIYQVVFFSSKFQEKRAARPMP